MSWLITVASIIFAIWLIGAAAYRVFVYLPLISLFRTMSGVGRANRLKRWEYTKYGLLWPFYIKKIKSLSVQAKGAMQVMIRK